MFNSIALKVPPPRGGQGLEGVSGVVIIFSIVFAVFLLGWFYLLVGL